MRGNTLRRTLQTNGGRYEETDINHCARAGLGRHFGFRLRLSLRQPRCLCFTGTERIGLAHQSPQSDALACPLGVEPLSRGLAIAPRSRPDFQRGESAKLALSPRVRQLALAPRSR